MTVHAIFVAILLMLSAGPDSQPQSRPEGFPNAQKLLDELKTQNSRIDLVSKEKLTVEGLQGCYSACGPTMSKRIGTGSSLSGWNLYLLPDKNYMFVIWADIIPPTIQEKGRWNVTDGLIVMNPVGPVNEPWIKIPYFLPLTISTAPEAVFLMDSGKDLQRFVKNEKRYPFSKDPLIDDEFYFLSRTLERTKTFTEEVSHQTQEDLLRYNGTWQQRPEPTSKPSSAPASAATVQN